jgi:hypothetical protein
MKLCAGGSYRCAAEGCLSYVSDLVDPWNLQILWFPFILGYTRGRLLGNKLLQAIE